MQNESTIASLYIDSVLDWIETLKYFHFTQIRSQYPATLLLNVFEYFFFLEVFIGVKNDKTEFFFLYLTNHS